MQTSVYNLHCSFIQQNGHYMVVSKDEAQGFSNDDLVPIQVKMIQSNDIPRLLPLKVEDIDFNIRFHYNIAGKRPLSRYLQEKRLSTYEYYALLLHLVVTLEESTMYMLSDQQYVLLEDFIYIGKDVNELFVTYLPLQTLENKAPMYDELKALLLRLAHGVEGMPSRAHQEIATYTNDSSFSLSGLKALLLQLQTNSATGGQASREAAPAAEPAVTAAQNVRDDASDRSGKKKKRRKKDKQKDKASGKEKAVKKGKGSDDPTGAVASSFGRREKLLLLVSAVLAIALVFIATDQPAEEDFLLLAVVAVLVIAINGYVIFKIWQKGGGGDVVAAAGADGPEVPLTSLEEEAVASVEQQRSTEALGQETAQSLARDVVPATPVGRQPHAAQQPTVGVGQQGTTHVPQPHTGTLGTPELETPQRAQPLSQSTSQPMSYQPTSPQSTPTSSPAERFQAEKQAAERQGGVTSTGDRVVADEGFEGSEGSEGSVQAEVAATAEAQTELPVEKTAPASGSVSASDGQGSSHSDLADAAAMRTIHANSANASAEGTPSPVHLANQSAEKPASRDVASKASAVSSVPADVPTDPADATRKQQIDVPVDVSAAGERDSMPERKAKRMPKQGEATAGQGEATAGQDDPTVILGDEEDDAGDAYALPHSVPFLEVKRGEDVERVAIDRDHFTVGRHPQKCQYVEDSIGVSRQHLEFIRIGDLYGVKDVGSKNGSKLNDEQMVPYKIYALKTGDSIKIGRVVYTFQIE
ncbi:DUF6382 domain-containing protein [Numidum massiliense]|uniref:DUF6382 domain-containing protein n=1 Tax=Numidum massiliense TaxID=1522315 RepID=UPI0006D5771D|nr:DUF6382 domain-containing protein [Numidum massiliense]